MSNTSLRAGPGTGADKLAQDALRLAVDTVPVLVAYVGREARYIYANDTYRAWFGLSPEGIRGKHLRDVLGPAAFERIRPHVERALSGERVDFEARVPYAFGGERFIRASYVPHRDAEGRVAGFVSLVSDVSEARTELARREEAERELRQNEGRFRAMADSSPHLIWVHDTEGQLKFVNRAYEEFFGVREVEVLGPNWKPLIHPDDAGAYVAAFVEAMRSRGPFRAEARVRRADGAWRWVSSVGLPWLGAGGEFLGMVGSSPDVTDMKDVEARLRESAGRFRAMAETVPSIVFTNTPEGTCDYVNARFYELTGLPEKAAFGDNWRAALHPEDAPGAFREWERCLREGVPFETRYRIRSREGGYHWFVVRSVPLRGPAGSIERWVGTATDVHALAEADRRKEEVNRTLELLVEERTRGLQEALRELESFSYSIAHDLRAPIRAMTGFSQALLDDYENRIDREGVDYLYRIRDSGKRMDAMIQDLLDYSRIVRGELPLEEVSLESATGHALLELSGELLQRKATVEVDPSLPRVRAHELTLTLAIQNLISNAAKFVASGTDPHIRVRAQTQASGAVRLWVEDNGIGIPAEHHERIFGVFERLHRPEAYPGTGIGLAIVRKAMERMGGRSGVESEPGKGSRFFIEFPALP